VDAKKELNYNKNKIKQNKMKETIISLQQELPTPDNNSLYFIDWTKVKDVNELFLIIASMGISFSPLHPAWNNIKHLMDYNNPINPNPQPQPKEIGLPKLKTIK
jgi:hypothetical protein